ncbi:MAG: hypothetical protein LQ343_007000 [Gyalolechia ehrenbergii]|nr:MAG: hypothetical protein LQ343_007000 [Gyalolechia ehrenbergii]
MRTPRGKIWPIHSISDYRGQTSFTRVGNTCKITDLSRIDLSKFERLHVDIQLPTGKKEGWSNRVESLTSGMKVFAKEVRKQQLLAKKGPAPWRPDIDVVIADCDPDRRTDPLSKFVYWEIYDVLDPLKVISDAKSVKIDVRVDMGFEQEFLQESIDGLVEDMRRRDGENGWSTYRAAIAKD